MSLGKRFNKILVGLGNTKALEKAHETTFSEQKVDINLPGKKLAESDNGQLWINYQELGGYDFLNLTIVSRFNIKTKNRCYMDFLGKSGERTFVSDEEEIESDNSNAIKLWITQMSFDVDNGQKEFISSRSADTIRIRFKKKELLFNVVK